MFKNAGKCLVLLGLNVIIIVSSPNVHAGSTEFIQIETNPIPDVYLPTNKIAVGARLKVNVAPFDTSMEKVPATKVAGAAFDELQTVAKATQRIRLIGDSTNCEYQLQGFLRNFHVTQFSNKSGGSMTDFMKNLFSNKIKVLGTPINWEDVQWSSTNSVVRIDCQVTLKLIRLDGNEILDVGVGNFNRVSVAKTLAAEIAGVKINTDDFNKTPNADAMPTPEDGDFIESRIIQILIARDMAKLIPAIDEEIQIRATKGIVSH